MCLCLRFSIAKPSLPEIVDLTICEVYKHISTLTMSRAFMTALMCPLSLDLALLEGESRKLM